MEELPYEDIEDKKKRWNWRYSCSLWKKSKSKIKTN
jgi:hypothetical protein